MAVPVQTATYAPPYFTLTAANSDAGTYSIILSSSQCNFEKGFTVQTGTLDDVVITILDSIDGSVFIDNTIDYAGPGVTALVQNKCYKCDLKSPVKAIKIQCVLADASNAAVIKVLAPNR